MNTPMKGITKAKQAARDEIAKKTAEFLAQGGEIKHIPYGPDAYPEGELEATANKKKRARERGQATPGWKGQASIVLSQNSQKNREQAGFKETAA